MALTSSPENTNRAEGPTLYRKREDVQLVTPSLEEVLKIRDKEERRGAEPSLDTGPIVVKKIETLTNMWVGAFPDVQQEQAQLHIVVDQLEVHNRVDEALRKKAEFKAKLARDPRTKRLKEDAITLLRDAVQPELVPYVDEAVERMQEAGTPKHGFGVGDAAIRASRILGEERVA